MKVVATSDLHGHLFDIPECDLLLIAGDIGTDEELFWQTQWFNFVFRDWLNKVPAKKIIGVAGNHDWPFEKCPELISKDLNWTYLQDSGTEYEGLKIWGSPWQLPYGLAFNLPEQNLAQKWNMIPGDTNILITHSPPFCFGDLNLLCEHCGSQSLTERIRDSKELRLAVYGHIHSAKGVYDYNGKILANVAAVNEQYELLKEPFMEFEI